MNQAGGPSPNLLYEARNVTKRYPGVVALDRVTFRAYRGQVNVLIGENGAGKSTLMRILAGVERADEGELLLDGKPVVFQSPREASAHGVSIVHQELSALENMTVSESIFAGRELRRAAVFVDEPRQNARSGRALRRLRKRIGVDTEVSRLPLGSRQLVEIARTLDQGSRILILDEPTSALSTTEAEALFDVIAELKRTGVTIIYISHRLHELLHLGDYFAVLRSGRIAGEAPRAEVSRQWIVERMTGKADFYHLGTPAAATTPSTILSVRDLSLESLEADVAAQASVHNVSFSLLEGEIVGIYGLLGAGRTELLEALAGSRRMSGGRIEVRGSEVRIDSVQSAMKAGFMLLPEDRQRDGLFPDLSIRENASIAARRNFFLSQAEETARLRKLAAELHIAANNLEMPITNLSGGNQQKALLARCLMCSPVVLLMDEPTRGVDVGAKAEIYDILRKLAAKGLTILFSSSEIEETRALSDRVLVLCQGRIAAEYSREEASDEVLFAAASPSIARSGKTAASAPEASA